MQCDSCGTTASFAWRVWAQQQPGQHVRGLYCVNCAPQVLHDLGQCAELLSVRVTDDKPRSVLSLFGIVRRALTR